MIREEYMEHAGVLRKAREQLIDDFKKINDTFGHLAGDDRVRNLGTLLKKALRRNDIVACYGGGEFAVLIPHEPFAQVEKVAEKTRSGIAGMIVPNVPRATVSIGCTQFNPDETSDGFFERADLALYNAKNSGKNIVKTR